MKLKGVLLFGILALVASCDVLEQVSGVESIKNVVRDNPLDPAYGVPQALVVERGLETSSAKWDSVAGAIGYRVYSTTGTSKTIVSWENQQDVGDTEWSTSSVEAGAALSISVAAIFRGFIGRPSKVEKVTPRFRLWKGLWHAYDGYTPSPPSVAVSTSGFLFTSMHCLRDDQTYSYRTELSIRLLGTDGVLSSSKVLASYPDLQYPGYSDCASDGQGYAVVWESEGDIRFLLLSDKGVAIGSPEGVVLSSGAFNSRPQVVFGDGVYFVGWYNGYPGVSSAIISPTSSLPLDLELPIGAFESIIFDGQSFRVFVTVYDGSVWTRRVTSDGLPMDSGAAQLLSTGSGEPSGVPYRVTAASDKNGFLLLWTDSSTDTFRYQYFDVGGNSRGSVRTMPFLNIRPDIVNRPWLKATNQGYQVAWTAGEFDSPKGTVGLYRASLPSFLPDEEPEPLPWMAAEAPFYTNYKLPVLDSSGNTQVTLLVSRSNNPESLYDVVCTVDQ